MGSIVTAKPVICNLELFAILHIQSSHQLNPPVESFGETIQIIRQPNTTRGKWIENGLAEKDCKWRSCMLQFGEVGEPCQLYSAFANSCPLQTDTFLFPLIHSHNVLPSSNKFY